MQHIKKTDPGNTRLSKGVGVGVWGFFLLLHPLIAASILLWVPATSLLRLCKTLAWASVSYGGLSHILGRLFVSTGAVLAVLPCFLFTTSLTIQNLDHKLPNAVTGWITDKRLTYAWRLQSNSDFYDYRAVPANFKYSHDPVRRQMSWKLSYVLLSSNPVKIEMWVRGIQQLPGSAHSAVTKPLPDSWHAAIHVASFR